MPRIRNWKSLDFCRPDSKARYDHIDSLFTENVDWNLIETHLPDMLRVVLSIKAGRISASTILRRLGRPKAGSSPTVKRNAALSDFRHS
jgi:TnpA family transposase